MFCLRCHGKKLRVSDSRPRIGMNAVYRKRECQSCGYQFATVEILEDELETLEEIRGKMKEIKGFLEHV